MNSQIPTRLKLPVTVLLERRMQLALGNVGVSGDGTNIFRGHDNVQGATDMGVLSHSLPGYYGLTEGAWKHWARVWGVDYEWIKNRFDQNTYEKEGDKDVPPMLPAGMPVSRWIDGVLEDKENIAQKDNIRAMVLWGHAPKWFGWKALRVARSILRQW